MCLSRWCFFFGLFFFPHLAFSQDTTAMPAKPPVPAHLAYVREADVDAFAAKEETVDSSLSSFHRMRGYLYDITLDKNIFEEEISLQKRVVNFSNDITLPYKLSDRTIHYY